MDAQPDSIRERLAAALPQALKVRDPLAVDALRSAIAAIENAAAVDVPGPAGTTSAHVAGTSAGVGTTEASRRELSDSDMLAIVVAEAAERETEATRYRDLGQADAADRLVAQAAYLREFTV